MLTMLTHSPAAKDIKHAHTLVLTGNPLIKYTYITVIETITLCNKQDKIIRDGLQIFLLILSKFQQIN